MMNSEKQLRSSELIRQAKESGLLDSNISIRCVNCCAVFPEEYRNCPQCSR